MRSRPASPAISASRGVALGVEGGLKARSRSGWRVAGAGYGRGDRGDGVLRYSGREDGSGSLDRAKAGRVQPDSSLVQEVDSQVGVRDTGRGPIEEQANESHRLNFPNRGERLDEGIGLGVGYGPLDPVAGSSSERDVVGSPGAPEPVGTVAGGLMDSRDLRDLVRDGAIFSAAIPTSFPAGFPPPSVDASGQIAQSSPVNYGGGPLVPWPDIPHGLSGKEAGPNGSVEPMHGRARRDGLGGELGVGPESVEGPVVSNGLVGSLDSCSEPNGSGLYTHGVAGRLDGSPHFRGPGVQPYCASFGPIEGGPNAGGLGSSEAGLCECRKRGVSPRPIGGSKSSWAGLVEPCSHHMPKKLANSPINFPADGPTVRFSDDVIDKGRQYWCNTLVGYFIDGLLTFQEVQAIARRFWQPFGLIEVISNNSGYFLFRFDGEDNMMKVFDGGPWYFARRPLILRIWEVGMDLSQTTHTSLPLWVKIFNIPLEGWNEKGIAMVASALGRPIHVDSMSQDWSQIGFAQVCVEMDVSSEFPRHINLHRGIDESTGEPKLLRMPVEYHWMPSVCSHCRVFGHTLARCPNGPTQPTHMVQRTTVSAQKPSHGKEQQESTVQEVSYSSLNRIAEHASTSSPVPTREAGVLMANRFCTLLEADVDIPSSEDVVCSEEMGGVAVTDIVLEEKGKRDRAVEDDSSCSGSEYFPPKSKKQRKRERKKKYALAMRALYGRKKKYM